MDDLTLLLYSFLLSATILRSSESNSFLSISVDKFCSERSRRGIRSGFFLGIISVAWVLTICFSTYRRSALILNFGFFALTISCLTGDASRLDYRENKHQARVIIVGITRFLLVGSHDRDRKTFLS